MNWQCLPYQGELKEIPNNSEREEPLDEFETVALANRLNISMDDMKRMSHTSLLNILLSNIENDTSSNNVRNATQEDIDRFFS